MFCNHMLAFGREVTGILNISEEKEWLVTNGLGSYASGTVSSVLTRRYHGLLVAALTPPLGKTLLATKLDETAAYGNNQYALSANRWASQAVNPQGFCHIESFTLENAIPTWRYALGDALLEKRIWMEQGSNTTYVYYRLLRASLPLKLSIKAMVNYRGFHQLTRAGNWRMKINTLSKGLAINAFDKAVPFYMLSDKAKASASNEWYFSYFLSKEQYRGLDCTEDHLYAGTFEIQLEKGESFTIVASTEQAPDLDGLKALQLRQEYENSVVAQAAAKKNPPAWIKQLYLAADQFIVDRPVYGFKTGKTVIAGYHWFADWGRDTMISLPGLTLCTGRAPVAKAILQTFAKFVSQGMLPNRFYESNEEPQYNTVDATLWYFEAIRCYFEATHDKALLHELFPVLVDIIDWHFKGTRYGIHVDPKDGLLHSGEQGVQLTWMDAKIGDWVVTPRMGKPVEINALWYNALKTTAGFARVLGEPPKGFDDAAQKAREGFQRFWNSELKCCFDVLDSPFGNDSSLRPNQIFAVSLPESPLTKEQQLAVVNICGRRLLTSYGLRSLDTKDPRFVGHYAGGSYPRDSSYHQGTTWGWLLGPYSLAHYKVHQDTDAALQILEPMGLHLAAAGIGTCSEIFDGDPPFHPRGCIAQAWTVAEVLKAWHMINKQKLRGDDNGEV